MNSEIEKWCSVIQKQDASTIEEPDLLGQNPPSKSIRPFRDRQGFGVDGVVSAWIPNVQGRATIQERSRVDIDLK